MSNGPDCIPPSQCTKKVRLTIAPVAKGAYGNAGDRVRPPIGDGIVPRARRGARAGTPPDWSAHRRAAQTPGQPEIAMLASNELRVGSYTCGIPIARRASR